MKIGDITTDNTEIQKIIREYYGIREYYYRHIIAYRKDSLEEMDKFLEKYSFPKLNQEEMGNLNRPITSMEFETVIRNLQAQHRNMYII